MHATDERIHLGTNPVVQAAYHAAVLTLLRWVPPCMRRQARGSPHAADAPSPSTSVQRHQLYAVASQYRQSPAATLVTANPPGWIVRMTASIVFPLDVVLDLYGELACDWRDGGWRDGGWRDGGWRGGDWRGGDAWQPLPADGGIGTSSEAELRATRQ